MKVLLGAVRIVSFGYCCFISAATELRGNSKSIQHEEMKVPSFADAVKQESLMIKSSSSDSSSSDSSSSATSSSESSTEEFHKKVELPSQPQEKCVAPEGQGMHRMTSDWHSTDLKDQKYFYPYTDLNDFLEGSALSLSNSSSSNQTEGLEENQPLTEAACEFRRLTYSEHFPHAMQQLYRCWSWWQSHPDLPSVLVWPGYPGYIMYVSEFLKVLQDTYNLTVIETYDKPTVQSKNTGRFDWDIEITDFAMLTPEHAQDLNELFKKHILTTSSETIIQPAGCDRAQSTSVSSNSDSSHSKIYPTISILNRSPGSRRTIVNINELVDEIKRQFPNHPVRIEYFDGKTFLEQAQFFMETDILISPHGAQLTGIVYRPSHCSQLVELLPQDYLVADYFGSLAKAAGIQHSFFYMQQHESSSSALPDEGERKYHYYLSGYFRDHMLCPDTSKMVSAVRNMVDNWYACCQSSGISNEVTVA